MEPPGTKFLVQVFLEGMSGKWRSPTALPSHTAFSLEEFPAFPGHGQAPDVQKLGTLLQNELNIKGVPRNSNPLNQLCIHLSSSAPFPTPMGESNSLQLQYFTVVAHLQKRMQVFSSNISLQNHFGLAASTSSIPKLWCFSKVLHVDMGIPWEG